jgi:hypothetical protein
VVWMIVAHSKPLGRVRLLASHEPESPKPCLIPDDEVRKPSWKAGKHPRNVRGAQQNRPWTLNLHNRQEWANSTILSRLQNSQIKPPDFNVYMFIHQIPVHPIMLQWTSAACPTGTSNFLSDTS